LIDNPDAFIPMFAEIRDSIITFHPEVVYHPLRTIQLIKQHGAKAGIALNPAFTIESLKPLLPHVDLLCVMTVAPGFVSQSLLPGGIEKLRDAGAQVFVAGTSSIFENGGDLAGAA
jgi:ribulose-phosphate 3-epimerase